MVGKGKEVAHGAVLMNYILTKEKAVFLRSNLLDDERDPDRIWALMQLHQINTRNLRKANHKIKNTAIEFEVSPSREESERWLPPDFDRLLDELLDELNRIDLSEKTGRKSSVHFDLRKCQFIAAIHYDSKSGLPHLHLGVNRIDMNGQALDCHKLGERILRAIHNINVRHRWELPEDIHEEHKKQIDEACMNALKKMRFFNWDVYGRILADSDLDLKVKRDSNGEVVNYVIMMGNSKFKASDLGKSRNLTAKNIEATWRKIHLQMEMERKVEEMKARQNQPKPVLRPAAPNPMRPVIAVPTPAVQTQPARYTAKYEVNGKTIDIDIPQSIYDILKQNCHVPEDNDVATVDDVVKTAVLLFLGYVDAATTVAQSCGGGGSQPESSWGKKEDEDDKERARRCAAMAHNMCKPKQKVKYKFGR